MTGPTRTERSEYPYATAADTAITALATDPERRFVTARSHAMLLMNENLARAQCAAVQAEALRKAERQRMLAAMRARRRAEVAVQRAHRLLVLAVAPAP